jgi:hypothetical protein
MPVSATEIFRGSRWPDSSAGRQPTETEMPPVSVNFTAVETRLSRIWRTRASSPRTRRGMSARHAISRPFDCARGASSSTAFCTQVSITNGVSCSASLPASILEKSRISSISASSVRADWSIATA